MKNNRVGFTLIEMLVVVLIMGILASIALPQYQQTVLRARYAKMMPLVNALKSSEEEYFLMKREYTFNLKELTLFAKEKGVTNDWETDNYHRSSLYKKGVGTIGVDQNGGGAPVVQGLINGPGGKRVAYLVYLDHTSGDETSWWSPSKGKRYCYSYTTDTSDWRYKLCASVTGKSGTEAWATNPSHDYTDPETGEDTRPARFRF